MNDNELILAELRKITAHVDFHRKLTKWSLIGVAVLMSVMIVCAIVAGQIADRKIKAHVTARETTWYDVDHNIASCNFDEAIRIGEELIQKSPLLPSGHMRLGTAYLAVGKLQEAEKHYAEAYRLFPSEEYQQALNALGKRIMDTPQPKSSPAGSPP